LKNIFTFIFKLRIFDFWITIKFGLASLKIIIYVMNVLFLEYAFSFLFLGFALLLSTIIFFLSYFLVSQKANQEKVSAYECGFNPFDDARATFDIRFYLIAILFLIFDLEISFLFP
jgi:NADH-quinone oxidoreductase subunit A